MKQGKDDLTTYFSKVQMALDELAEIHPVLVTINEGKIELEQYFNQYSLIMFLNGLSSQNDSVRD